MNSWTCVPVLRTGELLEVVPGLIVTQHSGDGKANQYFLRGFNLDHGTDLATSVDGVPVNMVTHAHGQGYTDINFVIPELVQSIDYRKGTYYADTGNFSAAGAVNLRYRSRLDSPIAVIEAGQDNYARGLIAASPKVAGGTLLAAVDYAHIDGPWELEENFHKLNMLARYSAGNDRQRLSITTQGYDGEWRSTDQIPQRAVDSGAIGRFGNVDPTDGGKSHRYSLSADWLAAMGSGAMSAQAYAIDYRLDLISNFTYAIDRTSGDQFEQFDDRHIYGANWQWQQPLALGSLRNDLTAGVQVRYDDIGKVGLYHTQARERLSTVREDAVTQGSYSGFASLDTTWTDWARTTIGVRADYFDFDVDASLAANSGSASDSIASPKFALVLGPWAQTDFFVDIGRGFHSNDARGTTISVDPSDGTTPVDRVDPLVSALGTDLGVRTAIVPNAQLSLSLWELKLDSELLFVGDAGTTEASRRAGARRRSVCDLESVAVVDSGCGSRLVARAV